MNTTFRTTMTPERRALAVQQHLAGGGVLEPSSVAAAHARQRSHEPPRPYTLALPQRAATAHRNAGEVPKPYTLALAARHAAAGTQPVATASRHQGTEPPKPWTIALQQRAAEAR